MSEITPTNECVAGDALLELLRNLSERYFSLCSLSDDNGRNTRANTTEAGTHHD